ncbi:MAG TPA: hypothetical protein DCE76_02290 [Anaerolineaceae bacterium]|nr:hypothetical protein [Anaerolineaceae bacterium]
MAVYTYLTDECKKQAQKHGVYPQIENIQQHISETQTTLGFEPIEGTKVFYKKRVGQYRLIAGRKPLENSDVVFIFWRLYKRQEQGEYEKLLGNAQSFESAFEKTCLSIDLKTITSHKKEDDQSVGPKRLELVKSFIHANTKFLVTNDGNDWQIYESKDWIERVRSQFHNRLESLSELVEEIINNPEAVEHNQIDSERCGVLYKKLADEKALFLAAPIQIGEDTTDLRQRYKIENASSMDEIRRMSRRAYPAFFLADYNFWSKEIESKDEVASLALSGKEMEVLYEAVDYPLLLNGRPGSGKTVLLLYRFAELLLRYFDYKEINAGPLYLTYGKELLKQAKQNVEKVINVLNTGSQWLKKPENKKIFDNSFAEFHEYLRRILPNADAQFPPDRRVDFSKFEDWYASAIRLSPKKSRKHPPELAWHVIRTYIKGWVAESDDYLEPEDYDQLPKKSKSVQLKTYEEIYEEVWDAYCRWCQEEKLWDDQDLVREALNAVMQGDTAAHSVVFCDEAQDFTLNEIRFIIRLSILSRLKLPAPELKKVPIALAGDPFQTINPTGFNWEVVGASLYQALAEQLSFPVDSIPTPTIRELPHNYRSNEGIVRFCNLIHLIRGIVFQKSNLLPQEVYFRESISPVVYFVLNENLKQYLDDNDKFTIILPCQKDEEKEYIWQDEFLNQIALDESKENVVRSILSSLSAKGLEFSHVILYKFGEGFSKEYPNLIEFNNPDQVNLKIADEQKIPFMYFMNRLYVAASRAKTQLIILDTPAGVDQFWKLFKEYELSKFIEKYQACCSNAVKNWDSDALIQIKMGEADDWKYQDDSFEGLEERARKHYESGKREKNAYLMELAAADFRRAEKLREATECEGYKYLYEENYRKAGDKFREAECFDKAIDAYWQGKEFSSLAGLSGKESDPRWRAAEFMAKKETNTSSSFEDIKSLLVDFSKLAFDKENLISCDPGWKLVFAELCKTISLPECENQLDWKEWRTLYQRIDQLREFGFLEDKNPSLVTLKIWSTPYPKKLEVLRDNGNNPDLILKYYDSHEGNLSDVQFDIVRDALKRKGRISDWEALVKGSKQARRYVELIAYYADSKGQKECASEWVDKFISFLQQNNFRASRRDLEDLYQSLEKNSLYDDLEKLIQRVSSLKNKYVDLLIRYAERKPDQRLSQWCTKFEEIFQKEEQRREALTRESFDRVYDALLKGGYFDQLEMFIKHSKDFQWYIDLLKHYVDNKMKDRVKQWVESIEWLKDDRKFKDQLSNRFDNLWEALSTHRYYDELEVVLRLYPHEEKYVYLLTYYLNTDRNRFENLLKSYHQHLQSTTNGVLPEEVYSRLEETLCRGKMVDEWQMVIDRFPTPERFIALVRFLASEMPESEENDKRVKTTLAKFFAFLLKISNWKMALHFVQTKQLSAENEKEPLLLEAQHFDWNLLLDECFISALLNWSNQTLPDEIVDYLELKLKDSEHTSKYLSDKEKAQIRKKIDRSKQPSFIVATDAIQTAEIQLGEYRLICKYKTGVMTIQQDGDMGMITIDTEELLQASSAKVAKWIEIIHSDNTYSKYYIRPWQMLCELRKQGERVEVELFSDETSEKLLAVRL